MFLHNDKELFKDIITETASSLGIDPSIIEKDYYVTVFLKEIVNIQPDIVFKGGTPIITGYQRSKMPILRCYCTAKCTIAVYLAVTFYIML